MKHIVQKALSLQEWIVSHRRYLHKNAEIDMKLPKTTSYVRNQLEEMGYEPQEICESGIVATVGGKLPGKVILLRADMDALPINEEADIDFKSTNGYMHACGHDLHAAMLLGAAKLLKEHEDEIEGTVKLMFQPGEETLSGAKAMVESGILDNPKVDVAMMMHAFTGVPIPSGLFIVPDPGASSAASDGFEIEIKGKGGHGAMPDTTIDPLNVLSHLHIALQAINSREVQPTDSAVVTIGVMHGGTASNIIPDTAKLCGSIRTFSKGNREFIKQRVGEIAHGVAGTFRAEANVTITEGCPAVVNDKDLALSVKTALSKAFGPGATLSMADIMPGGGKMMGSEDFSFVTERVPSLMIAMTTGNANEGYIYPPHHPKAIFDEQPLSRGAATYACAALNWLSENKEK